MADSDVMKKIHFFFLPIFNIFLTDPVEILQNVPQSNSFL